MTKLLEQREQWTLIELATALLSGGAVTPVKREAARRLREQASHIMRLDGELTAAYAEIDQLTKKGKREIPILCTASIRN